MRYTASVAGLLVALATSLAAVSNAQTPSAANANRTEPAPFPNDSLRVSRPEDRTAAPGSGVVPVGISDSDIELFTKLAYTWKTTEGVNVIECLGEFELRMGPYEIKSNDAVAWFRRSEWRDRTYYDLDLFLWRGVEVKQPGGTVETGDALLVTLRSFGKLVLSADGQTNQSDESGELYIAATRVRESVGPLTTQPVEDVSQPVEIPPSALSIIRTPKPPPPQVTYRSNELTSEVRDGRRVLVANGDVYVSRGSSKEGDFLELRADAAVLFLTESATNDAGAGVFDLRKTDRAGDKKNEPPTDDSKIPSSPADERLKPKSDGREAARAYVESVYLEGDVILTRGSRMIRASKLFYDLQADRALILDAVMRALEPKKNLPIYLRADTVRQLSESEYSASRPVISSSEFATPHLALRAAEAKIVDRTPRNERGEVTGILAGTYDAKDTSFALDGVPISYWPRSTGDFSADTMSFRSLRTGYTNRLGATVETKWYLFNLLGLEPPKGYDATLRADGFTEKGPATGIDLDYTREDYFGLVRSYYIHDDGTDHLGGNRNEPPDHDERGRFLWRHRQFLPDDWELSLETSYVSDDQYMEAYERNEYENGKDQETLAYLLKRQDNWQFSSLFSTNVNNFITQTEHYPDVRFSLIGQPLGDAVNFYSDSRTGASRYGVGNDVYQSPMQIAGQQSSGGVLRGDTRQEITAPLPELGPLKFTPYVMGRASAWDDTPADSGEGRLFGAYGLKGNMYAQKTFDDVESRLLDIHRLRHIIRPEFTLWNAHTDEDSPTLYPFDPGVESIDDFGGGQVGLRQRWQTKRGEAGRWRTVDLITLDVQTAFFTHSRPTDNTHGNFISNRPEDSISSNFMSVDFKYQVTDTTALIYDGVYDWNRGNVGVSNVSLAFEREPRVSEFIGWRYIHDTNNNLIGFGSNYRLNEKHSVGIREYYDIDSGRNAQTELIMVRKWPRWYTGLSVQWDRTIDDFSVNLSIWPEGTPNFALGSKRYTSMGESVGLRP